MPSCCTTNEIDRNWLVPVAAFFIHFVSLGMQYSLGLYFLPVSIEFNSNRGTTAWMGSLAMGLMLSCAFPAGYLMDVYDTRVLLALASGLLALGLLLASVAQSLPLFFLSIAASGLACAIHIQAASTIQGWFDEKKGLATGVAMAGSGFGNFIFALAIGTYLAAEGTSTHAWREALRWEAMVVVLFSLPASSDSSPFLFLSSPLSSSSDPALPPLPPPLLSSTPLPMIFLAALSTTWSFVYGRCFRSNTQTMQI